MTDPEMNVRALKKMSRPILIAAAISIAGGLSGCAAGFDRDVDASSPVAPRVVALVEANRGFPRWEDFPKAEAVPAPGDVATRVNALQATSGSLAGEVSRLQWSSVDPEAFQREVAARVDAAQASPASIETSAQIEARAAALRARAVAPPPIARRH
jgi:hypothetical protein